MRVQKVLLIRSKFIMFIISRVALIRMAEEYHHVFMSTHCETLARFNRERAQLLHTLHPETVVQSRRRTDNSRDRRR